MKKQDFIYRYLKFIQKTKLDYLKCPVGAGGVLLLLDLRKETADIDLEIPEKDFIKFKNTGKYELSYFGDVEILKYDDYIDLHILNEDRPLTTIDGVRCWTPEATLEFKLMMNREKDQEDIRKLKEYLNK